LWDRFKATVNEYFSFPKMIFLTPVFLVKELEKPSGDQLVWSLLKIGKMYRWIK
jgi:hypothetical protein